MATWAVETAEEDAGGEGVLGGSADGGGDPEDDRRRAPLAEGAAQVERSTYQGGQAGAAPRARPLTAPAEVGPVMCAHRRPAVRTQVDWPL